MAYEGEKAVEQWAWTENRVHELRRLIELGLCSFEIAENLGTSDCAVRNKTRRLGLSMGSGKGRPRLSPEVRVERVAVEIAKRAAEPVRERWPPIPLPALRDVETPAEMRVTVLELPDANACRWPMGHVMEPGSARTPFCGCYTLGLVYCPSHEAIARQRRQVHVSVAA